MNPIKKIVKAGKTEDALETLKSIGSMLKGKSPQISTAASITADDDKVINMEPSDEQPIDNMTEEPMEENIGGDNFVESQLTREKVSAIIELMKGAGYRDIYFDPQKGFQWNMYPPSSYIKIDFGRKFNPNGSFFINIINKLIITEEVLKEPTMLREKLNVFTKELDTISGLLKKINEIYPIVY
ncbi:hypothetical protein EOM09_03105 [bacterium]|nr:hypothetical protein [bacterium]